ncbi:hypothetical protein [Muninn virus]|nr:hypothetical protein [Muninn virus]
MSEKREKMLRWVRESETGLAPIVVRLRLYNGYKPLKTIIVYAYWFGGRTKNNWFGPEPIAFYRGRTEKRFKNPEELNSFLKSKGLPTLFE